jgi:hypothetical protein
MGSATPNERSHRAERHKHPNNKDFYKSVIYSKSSVNVRLTHPLAISSGNHVIIAPRVWVGKISRRRLMRVLTLSGR